MVVGSCRDDILINYNQKIVIKLMPFCQRSRRGVCSTVRWLTLAIHINYDFNLLLHTEVAIVKIIKLSFGARDRESALHYCHTFAVGQI